nr:ORF2 [Torque teno felis virus]
MTCYCCTLCKRLNVVLFIVARATGHWKLTAQSVTKRFGNKVVRERILSGVLAVIGPHIFENGLLPEALEMEETATEVLQATFLEKTPPLDQTPNGKKTTI